MFSDFLHFTIQNCLLPSIIQLREVVVLSTAGLWSSFKSSSSGCARVYIMFVYRSTHDRILFEKQMERTYCIRSKYSILSVLSRYRYYLSSCQYHLLFHLWIFVYYLFVEGFSNRFCIQYIR